MNFKFKERFLSVCFNFFILGLMGVNGLNGCSTQKINSPNSKNTVQDTSVNSTHLAKEFITPKEVAQLKQGMSALEVKNILGAPINLKNQLEINELGQDGMTYAYVLREDQGQYIEVTPYELVFKKSSFLGFNIGNRLEHFGPAKTLGLSNAPVNATHQPLASEGQANQQRPELSEDNVTAVPLVTNQVADEKVAGGESAGSVNQSQSTSDFVNAQNMLADEVIAVVQTWAQAWAGKNFELYLDAYAADFQHGMANRMAWEKLRRSRLAAPASITLTLSDIHILPKSASEVEVSFVQEYSTERMKEIGTKTLVIGKVQEKWKIRNEVFHKN